MKMMIKILIFCLLYLSLIITHTSCREHYTPKPYGYFRVDLPEHQYITSTNKLPYQFEMSQHAELVILEGKKEKYWIDIVYPDLNVEIHCSYKPIENNLYQLSEDTHRSVYKHLIKADDIAEEVFLNPHNQVYGIYYDLTGNAASVAQFTLTDSLQHFFVGAVYFNHTPNKDSIAPMAEYIKEDVRHLMQSFRWR